MRRIAIASMIMLGISRVAFCNPAAEGVAVPYPGAVPACFKEGNVVPCSFGNTHHDPFGYLTRDSAEAVKAFYSKQGMKFDAFPVRKDADVKPGDGLSLLQHSTGLLFQRTELGMVHAAPVEFHPTKGADDEPSYFNAVLVATGRQRQKISALNKDLTRELLSDPVVLPVALRPETAAILSQGFDPKVSLEKLIPLYNEHLSLFGSFFQLKDRTHTAQSTYMAMAKKRAQAMSAVEDMTPFQQEPSKLKDIGGYFESLEKEAYPTIILIQKKGGTDVKRDAATLDKEWKIQFVDHKREK